MCSEPQNPLTVGMSNSQNDQLDFHQLKQYCVNSRNDQFNFHQLKQYCVPWVFWNQYLWKDSCKGKRTWQTEKREPCSPGVSEDNFLPDEEFPWPRWKDKPKTQDFSTAVGTLKQPVVLVSWHWSTKFSFYFIKELYSHLIELKWPASILFADPLWLSPALCW